MGLLSAFGVGGGKLSVQLQTNQAQAGGVLSGTVRFAAGKRAQNITAINVRVNATEISFQKPAYNPDDKSAAQAPQQTQHSHVIAPEQAITGPITTQPGGTQDFPFSLQLPTSIQPTVPGKLTYHFTASADIKGEIDPGATVEVIVIPGMGAGVMPQMMGGGGGFGTRQPMVPMGAPMQPGMGMPMGAPMQPAMPAGPPAVGSAVNAQGPDGNWHPGRIVAAQNGMLGVAWDNPQLGQPVWVQPMQVIATAAPVAMPMAPPPAPAPFAVGGNCYAQWQDGSWQPARIAAMQNGMYGVEWENPQLGGGQWMQAAQLAPR